MWIKIKEPCRVEGSRREPDEIVEVSDQFPVNKYPALMELCEAPAGDTGAGVFDPETATKAQLAEYALNEFGVELDVKEKADVLKETVRALMGGNKDGK